MVNQCAQAIKNFPTNDLLIFPHCVWLSLCVCVSVLSVCVRIFFGMHFFQRDTPPPATTAATRTTTTTTTEKSNYCRSPNNPHSQLKSANFYFSLINTFYTWKYAVVVVVVLVATVGMLLPLEQARYAAKIPTPNTMHTLTPTHANTHRETHIKLKLWHLKTTVERLFSLGWVVVFATTSRGIS